MKAPSDATAVKKTGAHSFAACSGGSGFGRRSFQLRLPALLSPSAGIFGETLLRSYTISAGFSDDPVEGRRIGLRWNSSTAKSGIDICIPTQPHDCSMHPFSGRGPSSTVTPGPFRCQLIPSWTSLSAMSRAISSVGLCPVSTVFIVHTVKTWSTCCWKTAKVAIRISNQHSIACVGELPH